MAWVGRSIVLPSGLSEEPPTGEGGRAHDKVCNTDKCFQEPAGPRPSLPRPARRANDDTRGLYRHSREILVRDCSPGCGCCRGGESLATRSMQGKAILRFGYPRTDFTSFAICSTPSKVAGSFSPSKTKLLNTTASNFSRAAASFFFIFTE